MVLLSIPSAALAQPQAPAKPPSGPFGDFEVNVPGLTGSIDKYAQNQEAFVKFIDIILIIVRGLVVGAGVIAVMVGGYRYMTAGGDGGKVSEAKVIMGAGIIGILLAIAGQLVLDLISPQFSSDITVPKLDPPKFP